MSAVPLRGRTVLTLAAALVLAGCSGAVGAAVTICTSERRLYTGVFRHHR